ncbi:hypothetical protein B0H63DRAFT_267805 [Podospora didyma]|uniref:Secreted protein n=1 Tax=Podospora didyma TaxID=330526 RepID=A0AAE0NA65_9PEZI|nr:hypothetical protein B0H63DRAFT_267805 [Podospora didyma]
MCFIGLYSAAWLAGSLAAAYRLRVCRNKPAYKTRLLTGGSSGSTEGSEVVWLSRLVGRSRVVGSRDISKQYGKAWLVGHDGRLRG